jgi:glutamate-1-semialdehyde 2,1-aminomutase
MGKVERLDKSKELFESAKTRMTGGVHSGFRHIEPHPIYFERAKGSRVCARASAVVGKREIMKVTEPKVGKVAYAGTYNANQMSLAASKVVLEELHDGKVQEYLHSAGKQLSKNFEAIAEDLGMEARLQTFAGKFQVYFTDREVTDYRTAISCDEQKYLTFQRKMFSSGILMWPSYTLHHGITAAHTNKDIAAITKAMEKALTEVKKKTSN